MATNFSSDAAVKFASDYYGGAAGGAIGIAYGWATAEAIAGVEIAAGVFVPAGLAALLPIALGALGAYYGAEAVYGLYLEHKDWLKTHGYDPTAIDSAWNSMAMHLEDFIHELGVSAWGDPGYPISPLVLDMNGDGLALTNLTGSSVFFDMNANGFAQNTGWVTGGDAFLALDRNSNGKIDNISELFGNNGDFCKTPQKGKIKPHPLPAELAASLTLQLSHPDLSVPVPW